MVPRPKQRRLSQAVIACETAPGALITGATVPVDMIAGTVYRRAWGTVAVGHDLIEESPDSTGQDAG